MKTQLLNAIVDENDDNNKTCSILNFKLEAEKIGIKLDQQQYKILLQIYTSKPSEPNNLYIKYEPAIKNIVSKLERKTD